MKRPAHTPIRDAEWQDSAEFDAAVLRAHVRPRHRTPLRVYAATAAVAAMLAVFIGLLATTALAKAAHDVAHAQGEW